MLKAVTIVPLALLVALTGGLAILAVQPPKDKDKDKTPPTISDVRVELITDNSALITWMTDEPADSDIRYGIAPKNNIQGPADPTLVLTHATALSELTPDTFYAFCVESRDEANNKSDACGTFTTAAAPPPQPASGGGGGGSRPTYAHVSGFAYPGASISITLRALFSGAVLSKETTAGSDGAFSAAFEKFLQGVYFFSITVHDERGASSSRRGYVFDFGAGDAPLAKEKIVMPPTLRLARDVIMWGDDIRVFGNTVPEIGVLVEVGGVLYEARSDGRGRYELLINSARFAPGALALRARSSLVSEFGHEYSPTRTIVLTVSSVPKADINADGVVDLADLSRFIAKPVDMNTDGKINSADVSIFLRAFSGTGR